MNFIEPAEVFLKDAIEHAYGMDDSYARILRSHGLDRWSKKPIIPAVEAAYEAKIAADRAMHDAFDKLRSIRRA